LDASDRQVFFKELSFGEKDLQNWKDMSKKLTLHFNDEGVIEQFDGFFELKEIDLDKYREKYDNIYRMDRILHAEGKNPDNYQVLKQADTLMAFYNLGQKGTKEIIEYMGYDPKENILEANFDYYLPRTSHGSTLSRVVHSHLAFLMGRQKLAYELYMQSLKSDFQDIQGGTTGEGIHTGVMASTVLLAFRTYAGFRYRTETLKLNPQLPPTWENVNFHIKYRHKKFHFKIGKDTVAVELTSTHKPTEILISGEKYLLNPDQVVELKLLDDKPNEVLN
jgi:trehalose/maltose hydrolase-like predicted phosphorylase